MNSFQREIGTEQKKEQKRKDKNDLQEKQDKNQG
jgi:hypothetical protein